MYRVGEMFSFLLWEYILYYFIERMTIEYCQVSGVITRKVKDMKVSMSKNIISKLDTPMSQSEISEGF